MPETRKQQRTAGRELERRRRGIVSKQAKGKATRPFGDASIAVLRDMASNPVKSGKR